MKMVHVVGLGLSRENLTEAQLKIIEKAQLLVGGKRHLGYFPEHPAQKLSIGADMKDLLSRIRETASSQRVVVLASGDPNYYGIGPRLVEALGAEHVVIHPNITTVQAAFSRLKLSWHDVEVVSLHGRDWEALREAMVRCPKLAVYTDPTHTPAGVARFLKDNGWGEARLCVLEDLGQETEKITWLPPDHAADKDFSPLNLVVILKERPAPTATPLHLGMPEDAFTRERGLITKTEVRAVVLAKLALHAGQCLWDVGAGCGSVGLEASLLIRPGKIFAVEQKASRVKQIMANRDRLGVQNMDVICGEAPEALKGLPTPDRVFLGGGSHQLEGILSLVLQSLPDHGRLVMTAALMESVQRGQTLIEKKGWEAEITQLQINRGHRLGIGIHLEAINPVWIISARPQRR
jgi:precorrin-6Y C5,15-methyltransferase (decarboxylating)